MWNLHTTLNHHPLWSAKINRDWKLFGSHFKNFKYPTSFTDIICILRLFPLTNLAQSSGKATFHYSHFSLLDILEIRLPAFWNAHSQGNHLLCSQNTIELRDEVILLVLRQKGNSWQPSNRHNTTMKWRKQYSEPILHRTLLHSVSLTTCSETTRTW